MERIRTLPEYLKYLRKNSHYKQEEIAVYLHITRQTYSHYETGRVMPPISALYRLSKFYGISVDEMLEHVEGCSEESQQEDEDTEMYCFSEQKLFASLQLLNEQNRQETLSIMWEIMQAKLNKQNSKSKNEEAST